MFNKKTFRLSGVTAIVRMPAKTVFWKAGGLACLVLVAASCRKEAEVSTASESIQWIRVMEDTLTFSSENQINLGLNGKVVADPDDNLYAYYYASDLDRSVVCKYDPEGTPVWKKTFDNCKPLDMTLMPDGSLILAVSRTGTLPNFLTLYSVKPNGTVETKNDTLKNLFYSSAEVLSASLLPLADNSLMVSGSWKTYISGSNFASTDTQLFIFKHNPSLIKEWVQFLSFCFTCPYVVNLPGRTDGTSAVAQTAGGEYVFQFGFHPTSNSGVNSRDMLTGLLTAGGVADTSFQYTTSAYNRYGNGFLPDFTGDYVSYYSAPRPGGFSSQTVPAGFLRIGQDAEVHDTVPIPIPNDYRVVSCARGSSGFLLSAYKLGVANGASDYSGEHTLFLMGGSDWRATKKFILQEFYSDYFFSHAPVSDGGFVSMGRIQSFNGPVNKLLLIKWKNGQ